MRENTQISRYSLTLISNSFVTPSTPPLEANSTAVYPPPKAHVSTLAPLRYPLGTEPVAHGKIQRVADGIYWLRMPLPFALNHINLWLIKDTIEDREGWTLVDCGIDSPLTRSHWQTIIQDHLQGLPILRILVTHMHPDHIGLAHWIANIYTAPLWINATEFYAAHSAHRSDTGFGGPLVVRFMASHGLAKVDWLKAIEERPHTYSQMVPNIVPQFVALCHDQVIHMDGVPWRCIKGLGHSPEHISLYCAERNTLISGDMLLPKISTNVSVWAYEPLSNPLFGFLKSIEYFSTLPAQTLVCPSHGLPFTGAHTRVNELLNHHNERLSEIRRACSAKALCAYDVLEVMFQRTLDLHQITFAMGEALAHLHYLWYGGVLHRTQDANGIYRFHIREGVA